MKPGSKQYIRMMRHLYWYTVALTAIGIPPLIFSLADWSPIWMEEMFPFFLTPGFLIIGVFHFLSAFAPIEEGPNWSMVYPELSNSGKSKRKKI
jgi:hypothetical protein